MRDCLCALEALEFMEHPGTADLCCPDSGTCCDTNLTFSTIPTAVKEHFDETGEILDGATQPARTLRILRRYQAAIGTAVEVVSERACMARYAASACVEVDVCVPADCRCGSGCGCDRRGVALNGLEHHFVSSRVKEIKLGDAPAGDSVAYRQSGWVFYPPTRGCDARHKIVFVLKGPSPAWIHAVIETACSLVPCFHKPGCEAGKPAEREEPILRYICPSRADPAPVFGRGDAIRSIKWKGCDPA